MLIKSNSHLWKRLYQKVRGKMKKYCLVDHTETVINFYTNARFFGVGGQSPQENLEEKIKEVVMEKGRIIVKGEGHTRCSITAPNGLLKSIQRILEDNIGMPLNQIENLETL